MTTKQTKHTPEPWYPLGVNSLGNLVIMGTPRQGVGTRICAIDNYDVAGGAGPDASEARAVNAANARLIIAAPDLLEAAKDALVALSTALNDKAIPHSEFYDNPVKFLRAAIAKAEGAQ